MLLDRIEIDNHGPLNRVEIGPLSHHLNVVLGGAGSGKTAICRFIRDSLIDREYPRGMLSSSSGRIVWVDSNGWIHCRREQDGSPGGRRTVEFESRSESIHAGERYAEGWFDPAHVASQTASNYRSSLASRTLQSIRIPESIVDGVMIDTTVCSVSRVVASCVSAGLDREDLARLPFENETARFAGDESHLRYEQDDHRRRDLRTELADVEAELAKYRDLPPVAPVADTSELELQRSSVLRAREALVVRRNEAILEQNQRAAYATSSYREPSQAGPNYVASGYATHGYDDARMRELHHRADSLRMRASSLQRWILELDSKANSSQYQRDYRPETFASQSPYSLPHTWQNASVDTLRDQINRADREIVSLRRVLADVRSIQELLAAPHHASSPRDATQTWATTNGHPANWADPNWPNQNWHGQNWPNQNWLDRDWMQGRRYSHFVSAIDHYRSDRPWADFYHSAYQPLHPVDDLSIRIEATQRHLDWLLSRIETTSPEANTWMATSWFEPNERRSLMQESIRRVREQIRNRDYLTSSHMDRVANELAQTLDHLLATRARVVESLARTHADWGRNYVSSTGYHPDWVAERRTATSELVTVESELRAVLNESASLRRSFRHLPIIDPIYPVGLDRFNHTALHDSLHGGGLTDAIHSIDRELSSLNNRLHELDALIANRRATFRSAPLPSERIEQLRRRRDTIIVELDRDRPVARRESSLAELASRWLVRLSGGRNQVIQWSMSPVATDAYTRMDTHHAAGVSPRRVDHRIVVSIDRVTEQNVPAATRAIACLAVRMAAGELLGRMGHAIPLVLETHRELFATYSANGSAHSNHSNRNSNTSVDPYRHWTREGVTSDSIASALSDYAAAGRQLLVLTEYAPLAHSLKRSGARGFELHTQRIVHPSRPLWRSGQRDDRYAGPHGIDADGMPITSPVDLRDTEIDHHVNRAFDQAWIDTAGLREDEYAAQLEAHAKRPVHHPAYRGATVSSVSSAVATDFPAAGATYRDGYHYAQQSSTRPFPRKDALAQQDMVVGEHDVTGSSTALSGMVSDSLIARHGVSRNGIVPVDENDVPYFLTVDSPIDTAPSIDAVAAQRLRRIGISHITHLMNQDSNRLADTLGLAGVDAKTIRRWQSECRLMCRVPQLRGFDARVLVGCGIHDPAQLAAVHPTDLLDRVKTFLATERGQQILLSGTSYELSRITSWIASANHSVHTVKRTRTVDGRPVATRVIREDVQNGYSRSSRDRSRDHRSVDLETRGRVAREVYLTDDDFDQERYEVEVERRADRIADELDELTRDYDRSDRSRSSDTGRASSQSRSASQAHSVGQSRSSQEDGIVKRTVSGLKSSLSSDSRTRRASRSSDRDRSSDRNRSSQSNRTSNSDSSSHRSRRESNGESLRIDGTQSNRSRADRSQSNRERRSNDYDRSDRDHTRTDREYTRGERDNSGRDYSGRDYSGRDQERSSRSSSSTSSSRSLGSGSGSGSGEGTLRFYLERAQDVVDAPSIGPRMAERLNKIGIYTVDDLLTTDAETIAEQLNHRRVDADTVLQWQQQSTLVCRVPMMRGHDAQFLVAADVTTPEELAGCDPVSLFAKVDEIANSSEGKRIVRGGKLPDLEEVTEWITYAAQNRSLKAA